MQRSLAVATDVAIGGGICLIGDAAAQRYALSTGDAAAFDATRCGAMTSYGAIAAVPYHFYYGWLNANVATVLRKTAVECLLVVPLFEVPALTLWTARFGLGEDAERAVARLRTNYVEAVATGLVVWAPSSVLVFRFVRPRWHLAAFYSIGACWDGLMSRLTFGDGR